MTDYLGDFAEDADVYIPFDSANGSGASVTATIVVADIEVYRQNTGAINLTQRSSTAGFTLDVDHDAMTGTHMVAIDTSDNTDAGFFATGYDYFVKLNTVTVDSQTVSKWIGHFSIQNRYSAGALRPTTAGRTLDVAATGEAGVDLGNVTGTLGNANVGWVDANGRVDVGQWLSNAVTFGTGGPDVNINAISDDTAAAGNLELMYDGTGYTDDTAPASRAQVGNLSVGSGGISTTMDSFTATTAGTETNSETDTTQANGVYHIVPPTGGALDVYYEFNIGGSGIPQSVEWNGYVQGNNDNCEVYFYNWGSTSFEQVGTIAGAAGTNEMTEQFIATTAHVGTGANLGLVRFRFASDGGDVITNLATDRILCTYTVSNQSVGYSGALVFVDTNDSNTNTESFVDGTADNPVSTLAAATTIRDNLNLSGFHIYPGSAITLAQGYSNTEFIGQSYTLALGGQSIAGAYISSCVGITGTATGANGQPWILQECQVGAASLGAYGFMEKCALSGTVTLTSTSGVSADAVTMIQCSSSVAGASSPAIDASGVTKTTQINVRSWSGGLTVTLTSDCTMSVDVVSGGTITVNGTGGSISIRGMIEGVTDNSGGSVTITQTAAGSLGNIEDDTNELQQDDVPGLLASQNDVSEAQVNAQMVDALSIDTYAEPGQGTPPATASITTKIGYLYKAWRNRSTSSTTEYNLYNDDATTVDQQASQSDSGTFDRSEVTSGP